MSAHPDVSFVSPSPVRLYLLRFLARITLDPATGCWNWTGAMSQSGRRGVFYPAGKVFGRYWRLNRFVLICFHGFRDVPRLPTDSWSDWLDRTRRFYAPFDASHSCDNARCLNPRHLVFESHVANVTGQTARRAQSRKNL